MKMTEDKLVQVYVWVMEEIKLEITQIFYFRFPNTLYGFHFRFRSNSLKLSNTENGDITFTSCPKSITC